MRLLFFVLLFLISFVSSLDVDLNCPSEVIVDEIVECSVEVVDGNGVYDLKIEADNKRDSVLKILDKEDWKSSYYYLKEFIQDEEKVSLKFGEEGKFDLVVKLRQGDSRNDFEVGKIRVEEGKIEESMEDNSKEVLPEVSQIKEKSVSSSEAEVIDLGGASLVDMSEGAEGEEGNAEWDYISKDGRIIDWLPYGFCLFLIFLVGLLIWDRGREI